MRFSLV